MTFKTESEFEEALIKVLISRGWEEKVIKYPTEEDLIANWAEILFQNNSGIDRLNNCKLTNSEMSQILEQIAKLRTPLKLNGFINGKTITIKRDNPDDSLHFGNEVSLKIYDRHEIAAGESRYQIVQQPQFAKKHPLANDRRGDLMLLINGMPVIHIELKKHDEALSEAEYQIEKYSHEQMFTGLYSLIQVFVAMTPAHSTYFANPGPDGIFNRNYYFHWADWNNEIVDRWDDVANKLLNIPMAHQLIGFYTVPDELDGTLKVMRSYQYWAASEILNKVVKTDWNDKNLLGGYIWHTTGSGKTMTSFKSAQLIEESHNADKVVFLMDRIELGTQSVVEYRGFAGEDTKVQDTESTFELVSKLKSIDPGDTLIVTSIQKMSRISEESHNKNDIDFINQKRIVIIIDECHRDTFGDMLINIKDTFPGAIFFGFTGTPILDEHKKKDNTTATVFGDELHRYSIADGMRDGNVLGFDPYMQITFKDVDVRKAVALHMAKAETVEEAINDEVKQEIFQKYMHEVKMYGTYDENGKYEKGIEDYLPNSQYDSDEHRSKVVEDILENWEITSNNKTFSAIFATNSIPEAIKYYRLFKMLKNKNVHSLNIAALFDPNIDNDERYQIKEDGLKELVDDYNNMYDQTFTIPKFSEYKKDVSRRLAKKKPYKNVKGNEQIDLLIVVNQMLTGFDSKWINALYLDKVLQYENVIQAMSRTNRLFGNTKPYGVIKYYRKPHTMQQNINRAVKLYSGDRPLNLFVEKLDKNIKNINRKFEEITDIFLEAGIENFEKLPDDVSEKKKFAKLFNELSELIESARIQGLKWNKSEYIFDTEKMELKLTEHDYNVLLARYKELYKGAITGSGDSNSNNSSEEAPFDLQGYLVSIDTGKIDSDYMNSRFTKWIKSLHQENISPEELDLLLSELHKSYVHLSAEEQKYAQLFINDVQTGDIQVEDDKTFRDYINEYMQIAENDKIKQVASAFGLSESMLRTLINLRVDETDINAYGRFSALIDTIDKEKTKAYYREKFNREISDFDISLEVPDALRKFIIYGECDL